MQAHNERKAYWNRRFSGIATVITPLPDLSIRLSDGITLDQDDLIISRLVASYALKKGDQVIVIGDDDSDNYFVVDAVD